MEQLALFAVPSSTGDSEDEGDTSDLEPHVSFNADDTIDETHESDENDVATDVAEGIPPSNPFSHVGAHIEGSSQYPDSHMPDQSSHLSLFHDDNNMELIDIIAVHGLPQRQQQPAWHLTMDANEARGGPDADEQQTTTETEPTTRGKGGIDVRSSEMPLDPSIESVVTYPPGRSPSSPALDKSSSIMPDATLTYGTPVYDLPPPLQSLPVLMNQNDRDYRERQAACGAARRQRALDEAILRRREDLEGAEHRTLDCEAERARYRRSLDPLHKLPDSLHPARDDLDSEHNPTSRRISPPAPPSRNRPMQTSARFASSSEEPAPPSSNRPMQTRTRFASSSPDRSSHRHRLRHHGNATIHQYDRPDSPPRFSRQQSDSIRERGREVIERERARAAAEDRRSDNADNTRSNEAQWEPVFDKDDGRISELEYEDITDFWAGNWTETG